MNILPLVIGGAIILAVMQNKKSTISSIEKEVKPEELKPTPDPTPKPDSQKIYPTIGSKEIGYEIINCKDIIIYDAQKALSYAFISGKNLPKNYQYNSADLDKKLFGKCLNVIQFSKKNIDQARFIFDMIKYGYSGIFATVGGNETLVTNELVSFMQGLEMKFHINFTNENNFGFIVEIIKE